MRILAVLLVALFLQSFTPARAESLVAGMSQNLVSIDATFVGSEILIFGAVKREAPIPEGEMGVVIVVEGPREAVTVRRKERRYGIYLNAESMDFYSAPSFYAVASSGPLDEVLSELENVARRITVDRAVWGWASADSPEEEEFASALIRLREDSGLFAESADNVTFKQKTLFDTAIELPANLTEGIYIAQIFLTREGSIVAEYGTLVQVRKVGLERFLYNLAQDQPFAYAMLSLAIAIAAGYIASAAFVFFSRS
ncbi:TIGR02186 family protein [Maritimibacter dapengensis]|uniref:TIGR02186 family protein n=1 Tax=Maritimibacter dapengensis TaxID=2836868 RepID=A0ABS6T5Z9_9RHOB|nr:TIGR02186 family protein [Maritimibacter dapengensis]MBV7380692.1 TIGR02186 family protein [Maritimibacter dapengensis]